MRSLSFSMKAETLSFSNDFYDWSYIFFFNLEWYEENKLNPILYAKRSANLNIFS